MADSAEKINIEPLRPADFGLVTHRIAQFDATVSGSYTDKELENPELWVNVASKMTMGCEVRCLADDMSFVAYGICTFAQGSTAKIKITSRHELDEVDDSVLDDSDDYEAKLRGPKKWCIVKKSDGSVIKEDIPTQLECMRELEEYKKALRS